MCQEVFVVIAWVSGDVIMCRWGFTKNRMIGEKVLR